jgi:hypothetical protein
MLASHPQIYTGPETQFFASWFGISAAKIEWWFEQTRTHTSLPMLGIAGYITPSQYYGFLAEAFWRLVSALPPPRQKPACFLEKTPQHVLFADLILKVMPRARFIHIVRDCRAVVASMLRSADGWAKDGLPGDLDAATRYWMGCVRAGRKIPEMVADRSRYFEIKYEALVSSTRSQLSKLFSWLNLDADDDFIRSCSERNSFLEVRKTGVFDSIPTVIPAMNSAGQPGAAGLSLPKDFFGALDREKTIHGLSRLQRARIVHIAGPLLGELGYFHSNDAPRFWHRLAIIYIAIGSLCTRLANRFGKKRSSLLTSL